MDKQLRIVGMCGSLRQGSFNISLLKAVKQLAPAGVELEILELGDLPLFNQDLEQALPARVQALKAKIKAADAVIFSGPEYNYSVSGVLKNAIDWASRPRGDNSFEGKPAGIVGGSIGGVGSARMQYHLRQIMVFVDLRPMNRPEIMVPFIQEKFDSQGNLADEPTQKRIIDFWEAFVIWIGRLS